MTGGFAPEAATAARLAELERANPRNPFLTARFARALELLGGTPCLLTAAPQGQAPVSTLGMFRSGRLRRALEIPSVPATGPDDPFWNDLIAFARSKRVSDLLLHSYGTPGGTLPRFAGETRRRGRTEFIVDLTVDNLDDALAPAMRQVRKGRRCGLALRRSSDPASATDLERLFGSSMGRRSARGEIVPSAGEPGRYEPYLASGAGEIFFAMLDGEILSGSLVLRAADAGYYMHGGTSDRGRECGASYFLMHGICAALRDEGCARFNLGGAGQEEEGLRNFKAKFASERVELSDSRLDLARPAVRLATSALNGVRGVLTRFSRRQPAPSAPHR